MAEELDDLKDYKSSVSTDLNVLLDWDKDLIFTSRTSRGYTIEFDGRVEWGCMPTESLLASIAGCMAIDIVSFLLKMKVELSSFRIKSVAHRNATPPQYFKGVDLHIIIKGKGIDKRKMDRAVSLSKDKYCSVYHTMRKDMEHNVTYEIIEDSGEEKKSPAIC